jgi:putative redox protein
MNASIRWIRDAMFIAESSSGHAIVIDGPAEKAEKNLGIRPMEAVLLGLGSCTSFDVVDILKKGREAVTDCVTQLTAEHADDVPAVFTRIHVHFIVSEEKIMLERAGVVVSHDYEIVDVTAA